MPNLFETKADGDPLEAETWNESWDEVEASYGIIGPWVATGLVPAAGTGLSVDVTAGTALIGGYVSFGSFTISGLADNTLNHLYALQDGTNTSNTTGTAPANSVKLGTATTLAGAVTAVDTSTGSGRQTRPTFTGVITRNIQSKSANYTVVNTDSVLLGDATGGAFTFTLPTVSGNSGLVLDLKKIDSSANAITVDGSGAETIDGAATFSLTVQWQNLTIIAQSSGWLIL